MEQFTADLAQLESLQFAASDTNEQLLAVVNQWQQISPASLETAFGLFGADFLAAYAQAQQSLVRATTDLATVANTMATVTGRARGAFTANDAATANSLGAQ